MARVKILKLPFLQDAGLPSIAEDLVRNINRHAEVVLEGVDAMAAGGSLTATVRLSPCIRQGFSFNLVPKMRMDMDMHVLARLLHRPVRAGSVLHTMIP